MWIVAENEKYNSWVDEFETYEEAKAYYDKQKPEKAIYIAEVKEKKLKNSE